MPIRQPIFLSLISLLLAACAGNPHAVGPDGALAFQGTLASIDASAQARTRGRLATRSESPDAQIRLALMLAQGKASGADLDKAAGILDKLLKTQDPAARALHPLARLLAEQVAERQRLEGLLERQAGQLKDSQRKVQELQEKIDRLAEIERSLPSAARPGVRP